MPVKNKNGLYIFLLVVTFCLALYVGITFAIIDQSPEYASCSTIDKISKALDYALVFKYSPVLIAQVPDKIEAVKNIGYHLLVYILIASWFVFEHQKRAHFKKGIECGSSKWNDDMVSYNKKYSDPIGSKDNNGHSNMILTEDVRLSMNSFQTRLNNNVTVVGGSGSGKSRFFVKPNILQANCNYVITDPSGELLESTGSFLESQGYEIKIFNLVEMAKSYCYNPFDYIRDDLGVVMMIKCLIRNTTPPGQKGGDPFWEKSEEALLQALCFYLIEARPKKDRNFSTVMKLLRCAEVNEQDPNAESDLDKFFKEHERENPNSLAVKQYKIFKMGAGKTLKSILISCSVRLTVFNLEQIAELTKSDDENNVELEKMGEGKKALFVIIPSADSTYNFLVSMMYSQLFETLYFIAETKMKNKKLESPVRFLLDEFANIGEIPEFTKKLATMRKYDISCSIILQNLAQIKTMYEDDWQTILGNCDSFLFLGGQEYETVEYISKELGNATITVKDNSFSHGKSKSASNSFKQTKRELMTPDELMKLRNDECILLIRGLYPFRGPKCKYENCKNYEYTADANKKLKYELKVLNQVHMNYAEIMAEREREMAKKASKGELISDAKSLNEAAQKANIEASSMVVKTVVPKTVPSHQKEEKEIENKNNPIEENKTEKKSPEKNEQKKEEVKKQENEKKKKMEENNIVEERKEDGSFIDVEKKDEEWEVE